LRLLASELSGPEIAHELGVSLNTIRTHNKNIYSKAWRQQSPRCRAQSPRTGLNLATFFQPDASLKTQPTNNPNQHDDGVIVLMWFTNPHAKFYVRDMFFSIYHPNLTTSHHMR
jgi:hypothetical protein